MQRLGAHFILFMNLLLMNQSIFSSEAKPLYGGPVKFTGRNIPQSWYDTLMEDHQQSCFKIHRAFYLLQHRYPNIKKMFPRGYNFNVLHKNQSFYLKTLGNRLKSCMKSGISYHRYGRCATSRETMAFVRVTLGIVHSTINLCDEYFAQPRSERVSVLIHEFGRLEGIGDSEEPDTNNIFVWDNIVSRLSDDLTFSALESEP